MARIDISTGILTTGTIVSSIPWGQGEPEQPGIVLSNACDIEHNKAGYVIIAGLVDAKETLKDSKEYANLNITPGSELSKGKKKSLKNFFEDYLFNKGITRYYMVYPSKELEPYMPAMMVDFQHLISIPVNDINRLTLVAELRSPYREEMMHHFTAYTARVPVPREEVSDILPMLTDLDITDSRDGNGTIRYDTQQLSTQ